MITNNKVRTKYKIRKIFRLHFILSNIRKNIKNHDKKKMIKENNTKIKEK